jgi:hypothetical protein
VQKVLAHHLPQNEDKMIEALVSPTG